MAIATKAEIKAYFDAWRAVMADPKLTRNDLALMWVFQDSNFNYPCFSYSTLAEKIGAKSRQAIYKNIKHLVELGYITTKMGKTSKNEPNITVIVKKDLLKPEGLPKIYAYVEPKRKGGGVIPQDDTGVILQDDTGVIPQDDQMSAIQTEALQTDLGQAQKKDASVNEQTNTHTPYADTLRADAETISYLTLYQSGSLLTDAQLDTIASDLGKDIEIVRLCWEKMKSWVQKNNFKPKTNKQVKELLVKFIDNQLTQPIRSGLKEVDVPTPESEVSKSENKLEKLIALAQSNPNYAGSDKYVERYHAKNMLEREGERAFEFVSREGFTSFYEWMR